MNQKIPFHELSARIATATGISEESAEHFVRNFFELLSDSLVKGENVKIKGLGTFSIVETDGEKTIGFSADKEITDVINAPFAMFEPVKLNDTVSDDMLTEVDREEKGETPETAVETPSDATAATGQDNVVSATVMPPVTVEEVIKEDSVTEETISAESVAEESISKNETAGMQSGQAVTEPSPAIEHEDKTLPEQDIVQEEPQAAIPSTDKIETKATPTPIAQQARQILPLEEEEEEYVDQSRQPSGNGNFWTGMAIGLIVGIALGACGVYLAIDHFFPTVQRPSVEQSADSQDAAPLVEIVRTDTATKPEPAPSRPEPEAVPAATEPDKAMETVANKTTTDTIRRGYLITDMAKKAYGSKDYWVYIYEENKSKIGNPNNVQPGQVLVIPAAEKYGIVSGNAESLRKAQQKAGEILRKFPR